jgi:hypothetical protein
MKKRTRLICWIVIAIAAIAGIVCWQMYSLGKGLRTMQVDAAREVLVGALSAEVLAPGVDGNAPSSPEPLLEQYRKNPTLTHQRYLLVMTWVHASQIFKAVGNNPPSEGVMVSSASVTNVPPEDRVDGWGNPYCLLAESKQMTFLSSAGNGVLDCEKLRKSAQQAALRATDSRLTKEGNLLVTVYERPRDASATRPH